MKYQPTYPKTSKNPKQDETKKATPMHTAKKKKKKNLEAAQDKDSI